jgi:hypothetical protein
MAAQRAGILAPRCFFGRQTMQLNLSLIVVPLRLKIPYKQLKNNVLTALRLKGEEF